MYADVYARDTDTRTGAVRLLVYILTQSTEVCGLRPCRCGGIACGSSTKCGSWKKPSGNENSGEACGCHVGERRSHPAERYFVRVGYRVRSKDRSRSGAVGDSDGLTRLEERISSNQSLFDRQVLFEGDSDRSESPIRATRATLQNLERRRTIS